MKRPFLVTVLAIIQVLSGVQMLASSFVLLTISSWEQFAGVAGILLLIGFGYFVLAVLALLLARGYVKGFEKARRTGRRVALFAILLAIVVLLLRGDQPDAGSPVLTVIGNMFIYAYLGTRKVKAFFASPAAR
ncbi:MAG: hypothetical protein MUE55_08790 [Thermoplasmata archaeon]|jgi:hypothetical protein|nr:hypothetical protein [Thermoplasmata archaeon]